MWRNWLARKGHAAVICSVLHVIRLADRRRICSRIMHRACTRTATRNYVVRFLLFGIALLVENEWTWPMSDRLKSMRRRQREIETTGLK